jgi:hypothetical protein
MPGTEGAAPTILLRPDIATARAETSLGHELREIIENAFKRVSSMYRGLETNNNPRMNPKSDRFASSLLMPTADSRELLARLGYDLLLFSKQTGRSLPSVVVRAESLFPASDATGPLAGAWLFEAPWRKVQTRKSTWTDLNLSVSAVMNGFSTKVGCVGYEGQLKGVFPASGSNAYDHSLACDSLITRRPSATLLMSADRFSHRADYFLVAEPLAVRGYPWRVLLTAINSDETRGSAEPWLERVLSKEWAPRGR